MAGRVSYRSSVISSSQESIKLDGVDLTARVLKQLGAADEEMRKANLESAALVRDYARANANFSYAGKYQNKTGRLLRSLRIVARANHASVRGGGRNVPYANPIHWGWFYDRKNFVYKNIRPNPFLSRALGYKREEIIENYERHMQGMLDKYAPPTMRKR